VLNAERVCHPKLGEEFVMVVFESSCHGGEVALNDVERSSSNSSDVGGADVYEY
jgi:hypothetical protein